jgi:hypothetical protein
MLLPADVRVASVPGPQAVPLPSPRQPTDANCLEDRVLRLFPGLQPRKQHLRPFNTVLLNKILSQQLQIDKWYVQIIWDKPCHKGIGTVRINHDPVVIKLSTYDRRRQDCMSFLRARFFDKSLQIPPIACLWVREPFGILVLLVVVAELNQHIIAQLDSTEHNLSSSLADKTLLTSTTPCVILDNDLIRKERLQHLSPPTHLSIEVFPFRHRRIPNQKQRHLLYRSYLGSTNHAHRYHSKKQPHLLASHHSRVISSFLPDAAQSRR